MRTLPSALLEALAIAASVAGLACCASTSGPDGSTARLAKASCTNSSGSRIAPPRSDCQNVPGHSYSSRDIDNTGVIDPGK